MNGNDPRETRILAAIVFTDVVGFSRMAAQNEARVYVALQRDLAVMTSLCRNHQGQVLNTMGDGMLMCFMSAVDALTCALEIQNTLHHQSQSLPPAEVLQHRIGIHLGDVIMSGDNVFGDGVNVAARLQTVAKPGAIAYSATVHDVVRNKLDLSKAVSLGPQQLKNLGQPLKVWQIPPLEDSRKQAFADVMPAPEQTTQGATGFKGFAMIIGGVVLLGGVIGALTFVKVPPTLKPKAAKANPKPDPTVNKTPTNVTPGPKEETLDAAKVREEIDLLRREMRYSEIASLLAQAGKAAPEEEVAKRELYAEMGHLMEYLRTQVARATMDAPLRFEGYVGGNLTPMEISTTGNGMQANVNGQLSPVTWTQLGPENILLMANSLSEFQIHRTSPAPAQVPTWIAAFAKENGLQSSPDGQTVPGGTAP